MKTEEGPIVSGTIDGFSLSCNDIQKPHSNQGKGLCLRSI